MIRKISPHLSIYKFPLTAISSITNRVSGMYITGSCIALSFFILTPEKVKDFCYIKYDNLNEYSKKTIHCIFLYPFGYHFMGALRHLFWDINPQYLTKIKVLKSSRFLFVSSLLPTVLLEKKISPNFKH